MRTLVLALAFVASTANAAEVRYQASPARVEFFHQRAAFASLGFDTNWLPSSGPIRVRFTGNVGGGLSAYAPGVLRLGWQPSRALWPEGDYLGGRFNMDVGVEVHSFLKLDLQVPGGGPHYTWEGNLPGAPNFDYRFAAEGQFTPYLLQGQQPGWATISDAIQKTKLVSVPLTQQLIPIPGVGGYLDLYASGTLSARLKGRKMIFPEGVLTAYDLFTPWVLPLEPLYQTEAQYEAQVEYDGALLFTPTISLQVGPGKWDLFDFDIPLGLPSVSETWLFEKRAGEFDLPRAELAFVGGPVPLVGENRMVALDLGEVEIGQKKVQALRVNSIGRALLLGEGYTMGAGFSLGTDTLVELLPGEGRELSLTFAPPSVGNFEGTVEIATNDPQGRIWVSLTGIGKAPPTFHPDPIVETPEDDDRNLRLKPGCGCTDAGGTVSQALGLFVLALGFRFRKRRA